MATYRVCFDGKWQERFRDREEALGWARTVGDTGRIVHVAKRRIFPLPLKLVAVFPESRAWEGQRLWDLRRFGWRN